MMSSKVLAQDVEGPMQGEERNGVGAQPSFELGIDYGERRSTLVGSVFNAVNTIIGAGILALPSAIASTGYAVGLVLFVVGALLSQWGLHLLFKVMTKLGGDQLSFGRVASEIHPMLPLLASFLVWLICFAVATLYLTLAADSLVLVGIYIAGGESDAWYMSRTFYLSLVFVLLAAPLSVPKKLTVLQYTSFLALICIVYTTIVVVLYALKPIEELCAAFLASKNATECVGEFCCVSSAPDAACCIGPVQAVDPSFSAFMTAFPVIITAFCCSPQAFALYNDLRDPTLRRLNTATGSALSLVTVLYVIVSLAGYFTYGNQVSGDLLSSYPLTLEVTIARVSIAFLTTVSYPLLLLPARDSMIFLVAHSWKLATGKEIALPGTRSAKVLFYSSLTAMLVLTYCLGLLGLDITFLLNLGGALSVSNLSFTLPGIYYLALCADKGWDLVKVSCVFMIFFGLFIMIVNIVLWAI